jgi:hypothetical protein
LLVVGHEYQHADAGRGECVDRNAGQQQRADQGHTFAGGDAVDDDGGRQSAEERRDRQTPRPHARRHDVHHLFAQHDHRHRRECGTARHS